MTNAFDASWLRQCGLLLIGAKCLLVPLIIDPDALNAFEIPKAIIGSALSLVLLGTLLALFIRYGRAPWHVTPLHIAATCLLVAYGWAALFAVDQRLAVLGPPEDGVGLIALVDGWVLFIAISQLVRTRFEALALVIAWLAPLLPVVGYEVLQKLDADPIGWVERGVGRPFSTFGNPDILSQYTGALTVAAAGLLALGRWPERRYNLFLAAIVMIGFAGTVLTQTRAALVGFVVAALVVVASAAFHSRRPRARETVLIAVAAVVAIAAVAVSPLGQRFSGLARSLVQVQEGAPLDASIAGRLVLYDAGLKAFASSPVIGVGPGNFAAVYPKYRSPDAFESLQSMAIENSPHNLLLHVATDAGIVGILSLLATVVVAVFVAASAPAHTSAIALSALAALAYVLGSGLFSVNDAGTEWLFWSLLGAVAASRSAVTGPIERRRRGSVRRTGRAWALAVPAACVVVAASLALPALAGGRAAGENFRTRASQAAPARSVAAGEKATDLSPYRAEYWHGLGLSAGAVGDLGKTRAAFQRAVDLAPYNTTFLTNLARVQTVIGRQGDSTMLTTGIATARRAIANDPVNPGGYAALAIALEVASQTAEAVTAAETALRLPPEPNDSGFYIAAARAFLRVGRAADAEQAVRRGLRHFPDRDAWVSLELLLARGLIAQGRTTEALTEIDEVLKVAPDDQAARDLRLTIATQ